MQDVYYQVNPKLDFSTLKDFGFWKIEPHDVNPWYQCATKINWSSGLGIWHEGVSINNKSYEVKIRCDYDEWTDALKRKVQYFIDKEIIVENA